MALKDYISNFTRIKVFLGSSGPITSLDFSRDGQNLVCCPDDNIKSNIYIYDCAKLEEKHHSISCHKYGIGILRYTKNAHNVIHSSTKRDDSIRLLDLEKMNYIRYFSGHTEKVIALCVSPTDNSFLSGSVDNTIRLWDFYSASAKGLMTFDSRPVFNYDPDGVIVAVGINSESINLYDMRHYTKRAFQTFRVPPHMTGDWTSLKFSPNGKTIMINTKNSLIHIIDAFTGEPLRQEPLKRNTSSGCHSEEASFTPDSEFIFSGCNTGQIIFWNQSTFDRITLKSDHKLPVKCVEFNPKYMMFASACKELHFWIPAILDD